MAQILLTFVLGAWFTIFALAAPPQFRLPDVHGGVHTAAEWSGRKAIVLFFVIQDCPVSNSYVPEMNRIEQTYSSRGIRFYAVQTDISAPAAVSAEYARAYRLGFPLLLDSSQILVRLADATVTPQVAILSAGGEVLYRGRIDNRVEDFGSQRPEATVHDLRDALDAVLAGHPPRIKFTRSIGCAIARLEKK
jgi:peroxiredoxin